MAEQKTEQVRDILLLPSSTNDHVHDSASDQMSAIVEFLNNKIAEYNEVIQQNCRAVFVVNYVQNRFIASEFCPEIAKLFEVLKVNNYDNLIESLERLKTDPEMRDKTFKKICEEFLETSVDCLEEAISNWESFLKEIDDDLDKTIGPLNNQQAHENDESAVLGLQSKTISYYVTGSSFDCVLIVVVRSFNKPEANEHILELYKRIDDFRKLGCDVFLLTKGPPIGSRGGAYIKLIGVPFRKLYDASEAENELKAHRKSAVQYTNWEALCRVMESSLVEEGRPTTGSKDVQGNEEPMAFISQKGGTVLVNKSGEILFKHIEDEKENDWPNIDEVLKIVEAQKNGKEEKENGTTQNGGNITKVNSEISVGKEVQPEKKKSCCVIC